MIDKPLKKLTVCIENEEKEDVVIIFAQPSTKDLELVICDKNILNMVSDFLWIKKERREILLDLDEGKVEEAESDINRGEKLLGEEEIINRKWKERIEKMKRGEELWKEMWGKEIQKREEDQLFNKVKVQEPVETFSTKPEHQIKIEHTPILETIQQENFDSEEDDPDFIPNSELSQEEDGEKRFSCDICGQSYARQYNLTRHQEKDDCKNKTPRRKFSKKFKKTVVEAYLYDPETKGNQLKTGQKYGVNKTQIQNWLTKADILENINVDPLALNTTLEINKEGLDIKIESELKTGAEVEKGIDTDDVKEYIKKIKLESKSSKAEIRKINYKNKPKLHGCEDCGKYFRENSDLIKHKRVHSKEPVQPKIHTCDDCGKEFTKLYTLKIHKRKHSSEKPFSCHICGRTFKFKSSLITHDRLHTGEKPFQCDVCEKTFTHKLTLINHKRLHDENCENLFSCDVCGKSFPRKYTLDRHQEIHLNEDKKTAAPRNFKCEVCENWFSMKSTLRRHFERKHMDIKKDLFPCDLCGKGFPRMYSLNRHKKRGACKPKY